MATSTNNSSQGKNKQAKLIRTILKLPKKQQWRNLNDDETNELLFLLKRILTPLKLDRDKVPWKKLRQLDKEQRKKLTDEHVKDISTKESRVKALGLRKYVIFGVNSISRNMESGNIASCLLASDVSPTFLLNHLIQLAEQKKVPFLVMPRLKQAAKEALGFPSLAIALHNSVHESDNVDLLEMRDLICSLSLKANLIQDASEDDTGEKMDLVHSPVGESIPTESFYLYRKSDDERVFKPSGEINTETKILGNVKLCLEPTDESYVCKKRIRSGERYYTPPIVNKVQSNSAKKINSKKLKSNT